MKSPINTIRRGLLALLLLPALCWGLTTQQLQTLKTAINANPTWAALPMTSGAALEISAALNQAASPAWYVWRTNVTRAEIYHQTSAEGTTWNWTTYKAQSVTEQNAWIQMFMGDVANFALPNLRSGVDAIFSGAGAPATQRAHVAAVAKRTATVAEKLFSTGTGSQAVPATMGWEGTLTADDVAQARELP